MIEYYVAVTMLSILLCLFGWGISLFEDKIIKILCIVGIVIIIMGMCAILQAVYKEGAVDHKNGKIKIEKKVSIDNYEIIKTN